MSLEPRVDLEHRPQGPLDRQLQDLARRIREWLDESRAQAGSLAEIIERVRQESRQPSAAGTPCAATSPGDLAALARFAHDVETCPDQVAILGRLVDGAARQASRALLFVVRNESLVGWSARGFTPGFSARGVVVQSSGDSAICRARASSAPVLEAASDSLDNEELAAALGGEAPRLMMAAPLWVRDRVVAVLYADTFNPRDRWNPDAIRLMTSLAALGLEAIPARVKFPRPVVSPDPAAVSKAPGDGEAASSSHDAASDQAPAAQPPDGEELQLREEARRFARLLVSEILLYNEKEIEEGRRNKDLYERLREDIDRSRQMYLHRVSPRMTGAPDYFRQELVRTLAGGDESALNAPWD